MRRSLAIVLRGIAEIRGVGWRDVTSLSRRPSVTRPRLEGMYLARQLTDASLPEIGRALNRDHSTVLSGVRRIEAQIDETVGYGDELQGIGARLVRRIERADLREAPIVMPVVPSAFGQTADRVQRAYRSFQHRRFSPGERRAFTALTDALSDFDIITIPTEH